MNAIHPRVSSTGKPWVDCPKCNGTGLVSGISKAGNAFSDRPCFRCSGTGDGNIVMPFRRSGGFGSKRGGASWPAGMPASAGSPAPLSEDDDDDDEPLTVSDDDDDDDDVAAAARNLAAAIAARRAKAAPLDEAAVRRIAEDVLAAATLPRPLDISVNGVPMGTLPALRHHKMESLMRCIAAKKHVALVGPAASGKTTAPEQIAEALGLKLYVQKPIADTTELTGFVDGMGKYHTTPLREAFEHGGMLNMEEFDGSLDAGSPLTIHAALANGYMTFPDSPEPVKRHPDFVCIVNMNTFGTGANAKYIGRTQLDAATLDRFFFMTWDYDPKIEEARCGNADWLSFVRRARDAVERLGLEVVISPRASENGADLLAAGMSREEVEKGCLWKGLSAADVQRIQNAMRGA